MPSRSYNNPLYGRLKKPWVAVVYGDVAPRAAPGVPDVRVAEGRRGRGPASRGEGIELVLYRVGARSTVRTRSAHSQWQEYAQGWGHPSGVTGIRCKRTMSRWTALPRACIAARWHITRSTW